MMDAEMQQLVQSFQGKRIAVWGDLILDEYITTCAARVSREAPVLITEFESADFRLGGAGNVAANIRSLGGEPFPIGFIGMDQGGDILREVLCRSGIPDSGLLAIKDFTTPRKTRILSGDRHTRRQQVLRIDRLNRSNLSEQHYANLLNQAEKIRKECSFLVISDYLHCSIREQDYHVARNRFNLTPVAVDSRRHLRSFPDVRVATPNLNELQRVFPENEFNCEEDYLQAAMGLRREINSEGLLLKRGDEGMILLEADQPPTRIGIYGSREIVDVTGAGDTVIALLSLGLASGADITACAKIAAVAAGLTVMKAGAATVTPGELSEALSIGTLT
ncbi:MAG: sugar kinase [Candidatus Aminicenantes bacterium]|nr:sugar kinase [Candidatus Aminicenantes bacterium]